LKGRSFGQQAVIGLTERALPATREPFGAPSERDGLLIGEVGT
jgi:hypothetical protein